MEKLKSLLQSVAIIQKKYDDLAEYSGEHYNIFDILGVRSNELSHSSILTNLLDPKGKHGQKDVFLKLFLEQINSRFKETVHTYHDYLKNFVTQNATANKEIYVGGVNFDLAEGGRVDIVITSANQNIIIENKIYAGDQEQQLLRYNNHFKNQPIIYLTLDGSEPSESSKGNLVLNKDFICCSYKTDIKEWLEKCIKKMTNKPFIRETLNQYLILIKELTNQSNNNKMSEDISKLIVNNIENFGAFITILEAEELVKKEIILVLKKQLLEINLDLKLIEESYTLSNKQYSGFELTNEKLKSKNLKIRFEFMSKNYSELHYGFQIINKKELNNFDELKKNYKAIIGEVASSNIWPAYSKYHEYRDWSKNTRKVYGDVLNGEMIKSIIEKLSLMLKSFEATYNN
ncbi:PD-(D/E)XK nuclease family protein [Flavobacterium sp.]|uniref:PDDEXK-like family protein n=1 Tax=Flavobacterium sp. TaxID=239 RepID=UPI001B5F7405|nr:PD-(D/E)XK nuclease family protein [Flavobacterium sp.]MBP6128264.1 PD-(D/E)XK nuclease family protein [Flavobacterium sp.]